MSIWIAIGGTPPSVIKAGTLNLPLALAIIGGNPQQFVPLTKLYRDTARTAGHDFNQLPLGINSHVYISDDSQKADEEFYPSYADVMTKIGRERGCQPMNRQQFELMRSPQGYLLVGSPRQVIDKILFEHEFFQNSRFLAPMSVGTLPYAKMMRSIELSGTEVAPVIRRETAKKNNLIEAGFQQLNSTAFLLSHITQKFLQPFFLSFIHYITYVILEISNTVNATNYIFGCHFFNSLHPALIRFIKG